MIAMMTDSHRIIRLTCLRLMPDRTQEPELARPFEDRETERVHDAEQRDQDGERQEREIRPRS